MNFFREILVQLRSRRCKIHWTRQTRWASLQRRISLRFLNEIHEPLFTQNESGFFESVVWPTFEQRQKPWKQVNGSEQVVWSFPQVSLNPLTKCKRWIFEEYLFFLPKLSITNRTRNNWIISMRQGLVNNKKIKRLSSRQSRVNRFKTIQATWAMVRLFDPFVNKDQSNTKSTYH